MHRCSELTGGPNVVQSHGIRTSTDSSTKVFEPSKIRFLNSDIPCCFVFWRSFPTIVIVVNPPLWVLASTENSAPVCSHSLTRIHLIHSVRAKTMSITRIVGDDNLLLASHWWLRRLNWRLESFEC